MAGMSARLATRRCLVSLVLLVGAACSSGGSATEPSPSAAKRPAPTEASGTGSPAPAPSPTGSAGGSAVSHVVLIVMENHEYQEVIGAAEASYVNSLAARSVLLTRSYAITHPSLPNYLALVGGSTFGIHSDCTDCAAVGRNLGDQLSAKGVSWKAYMEDLPSACWQGGGSGGYAKKHDP